MAATAEPLSQKPSHDARLRLLKVFFGVDTARLDWTLFGRYFQYYDRELAMLKSGALETVGSEKLVVQQRSHDDLVRVLNMIRPGQSEARRRIIDDVARVFSGDMTAAGQGTELVMRLWLMMNVRDARSSLHAPQTPVLGWEDQQTVQDLVTSAFPTSRWNIEAKDSRLHPSFTATFMVNICGLKLEWTDCLADHLRLDRRVNALRVFSYKEVLQAHLQMHNVAKAGQPCDSPFPERLLMETIWSLNLLFPQWDPDTSKLLKKHSQSFQRAGPYSCAPTLNLVEFQYWRDRLSELHDVVFLSPPASWAQLWRDRRNPQQFWTFWLALIILLLTLVSTITGIVQAWASVKALKG
jgi:hypothetical protein